MSLVWIYVKSVRIWITLYYSGAKPSESECWLNQQPTPRASGESPNSASLISCFTVPRLLFKMRKAIMWMYLKKQGKHSNHWFSRSFGSVLLQDVRLSCPTLHIQVFVTSWIWLTSYCRRRFLVVIKPYPPQKFRSLVLVIQKSVTPLCSCCACDLSKEFQVVPPEFREGVFPSKFQQACYFFNKQVVPQSIHVLQKHDIIKHKSH